MTNPSDRRSSVAEISNHYLDLIHTSQQIDIAFLEELHRYFQPDDIPSQMDRQKESWWKRVWLFYLRYTNWIVYPFKVKSALQAIARLPGILPFLWLELIAVISSTISIAAALGIYSPRPSQVTGVVASIFEKIFWVAIAWITPAIYHRALVFLRDRNIPGLYRFIFSVVVLGEVLIIVFYSHLFLQGLGLHSNAPVLADLTGQALFRVALVIITTLVPSLIYLLSLTIDSILFSIWVVGTGWVYFFIFHKSQPIERIQKLILEPIRQQNTDQKPWKLIDLDIMEIEAIQAWAEANREGTEKRLLPTIVLFSLIQLIGWSTIADSVVWQRIVEFWARILSWFASDQMAFLGILFSSFIGFVLAVSLVPFIAIVQLFSNILPQSLIIEACIAAKYIYARDQKSHQDMEVRPHRPASFLERLAYLLGLSR